ATLWEDNMASRLRLFIVGAAMTALIAPGTANALTSSPASSWQTNGRVRAIVVAGGKIFIGGDFTRVRAPGAGSGGGLRSNRLAAIGQTSTARLAPWHPNANSTVRALTMSSSGKRVFAGGSFRRVNGRLRPHLAALWVAGGLSRFAAHPIWPVNALRTAGKR